MSRVRILILVGALAVAGCASQAVGGEVVDASTSEGDAAGVEIPDAGPACASVWRGDTQTGTALDDRILGMALDSRNNLYVTGYEAGTNRITNIEPSGDSRAVVNKYSPTGELLWKTTIDTTATETAEDVAIDPLSGNLFVVGRTSGALDGFVNQGQFDLFLSVLQPTGQILSSVQLGNERPQRPLRLSVAGGGWMVATGLDDTYIPSNFVAAPEDGFALSFTINPAGGWTVDTRWWQYLNPSPGPLSPYTRISDGVLEPDGSGALYVVGNAPPPLGGVFAMKLDADGQVLWREAILPLQLEAANAVALSPSGELFVTGGTLHQLGPKSFGQEDAYLMKLDKATGATLWAAQAGGPDSELATAIGFDASNHVYLAGITLGSVVAGVQNQGSVDLFAMKFDATGQLLSSWQTGSSGDDEVTSMVVTPCGEVFLGGFTNGDLVGPNANPGTDDMFILNARLGE